MRASETARDWQLVTALRADAGDLPDHLASARDLEVAVGVSTLSPIGDGASGRLVELSVNRSPGG